MAERELTFREKQERRDGAIVDFSRGLINRREFMRRVTTIGVSAAFAGRMADALAAPKPVAQPSRWAKQAEATVTMIKGPHHTNDKDIWNELKKEFEASHPGITLNPTFFKWETMPAELTAGYASDSPADVVYLVDLLLARFSSTGQVHDIASWVNDPAWAAEKAGIQPWTWDVTTIEGKTYGVGVLGAVFNIFYNVDLFEKAGITSFPDTRQGLIEAAQALTKDGVYGFHFRDRFPDYGQWPFLAYLHNDGFDIMTSDLTAQNVDPGGAATVQYLADMKVKYKVSPEAGAYDWNGGKALFEAGRIAILDDEAWKADEWERTTPLSFKWDIALNPKSDSGKQTAMGNFGYASISEKSPNQEAAWEFVKWWASADISSKYAADVGLQGVRADVVPPSPSTVLQRVQQDFVPKVQGVQIHQNYLQMIETFWPEMEKAYRGQQTGEQAMKNAGDIINGLINPS
jgi:ABC-type glycerol-3-phosphate transport system substrate-binding protein